MAGITNAEYVLERAAHVGVAFIGGFSLDDATQEAARKMVEAGRTEFSDALMKLQPNSPCWKDQTLSLV